MYRSEGFDAISITSSLCRDVVVFSSPDVGVSSDLDVIFFRVHRGDNHIVAQ